MKNLYITALLATLCCVFGYTAYVGEPETKKIKLQIHNPITFAERLEWIHDWNNCRGHAIIVADRTGTTPEEALACMSGNSSEKEIAFYKNLWTKSMKKKP